VRSIRDFVHSYPITDRNTWLAEILLQAGLKEIVATFRSMEFNRDYKALRMRGIRLMLLTSFTFEQHLTCIFRKDCLKNMLIHTTSW